MTLASVLFVLASALNILGYALHRRARRRLVLVSARLRGRERVRRERARFVAAVHLGVNTAIRLSAALRTPPPTDPTVH